MNKIQKRVLAFCLAMTMVGSGLTGCSANYKDNEDTISINVTDIDSKYTEFTHILYLNNTDIESSDSKDLLCESDSKTYTNYGIKNHMSAGFFNNNLGLYIAWPDTYNPSNIYFGVGVSSFKVDVNETYYKGLNGDNYIYTETKMIAKEDIISDGEEKNPKTNEFYKKIYKGDELVSKAIWKLTNGKYELVAYSQTGIGSDADNIRKLQKGNVKEALISIGNLISEDVNMTYDEAKDYISKDKSLTKNK